MNIGFILELAGLVAGLIGSILLAISINRVITELVLAINFLDTTVGALCGPGDVPRFTGVEHRLDRGIASAKRRTFTGIFCLVISFALQLVALWM